VDFPFIQQYKKTAFMSVGREEEVGGGAVLVHGREKEENK
jgi:hypothetical protein